MPFLLLILLASPEDVVARVDGRAITAERVLERQAATRAAGGATEVEGLVEDLINESLLWAEGYRLGLAKAPAVVAAAEAARRRLASERFVEKELFGSLNVDDAQLRALYHDTGDSAHLLLIVRASEEEARAVVDRLAKGASFAEEARHSLDPEAASRGGDLGTQSRGQLEAALAEVAFSTPLGNVTGPVRLALGWGVVKVAARYVADEAGFAARKEDILRFARGQMRREFKSHYIQQLRKKYKASVDDAFIKSTGPRLSASPEEAARVVATAPGRTVRYGELLERLVSAFGQKESSHTSGPAVKLELLWKQVDDLLLEAAAIEAGYGKDAALLPGVRRAEEEAVVRELARELREGVPPPTPADVEAYYRQHAPDYTRPGKRVCSHLLTGTREHAGELRRRALRGEPFEDLAREYSRDARTAVQGGLLGDVTDDQLAALARPGAEPALAAEMRGAKQDQVSEPVQSKSGWHLVKCGVPIAQQLVPLEEIRNAVAKRLRAERETAAVRERVTELRARAKITVDREALGRLAGGAPRR